jgi:hypothetical protein
LRSFLPLLAALAAVSAAAQPLPAPPFAAPWLAFNTTAGSGTGDPLALAVGDFTGDGLPDVVAAQGRSATGFVLMANDGEGRLVRRAAFASPDEAADVVAADFDGDGALDVALSNSDGLTGGTGVSLFLGAGDGTFEPRRDLPTGAGSEVPVGLAAADFDGDGALDLAVAAYGFNGQGSTVRLLRGDGAGGFAAPVAYQDVPEGSTGSAFATIALADVEGDGDLDVFYSNTRTSEGSSGAVGLLRNDGAGVLGDPSSVALPLFSAGATALATADLDGDGDPDLVANQYSARTTDGLVVALNDGTGAFGAAVLYKGGQSTFDVAAADMDGDGDADLLSSDDYSRAVTVRYNPGGGVFPALPADYAEFLQSYADAADVDGDGDLDAFTSGIGVAYTQGAVMRNGGTGRFARTGYQNGIDGVAFGVLRDLDGDGWVDLLFNNPNTASQSDFFTALNNGDGTFPAPTRWVVQAAGWGHVDAVDLDGDGDLDVVDMEALGAPDLPPGRFFIALNNGDGTFQTPAVYDDLPGRPFDVAPGDYDEDGDVDLAMTRPGAFGFDDQVMVVLGNGDGTFGPPTAYTVGRGPKEMVAADLDGDGHLDLATGNTGYDNEGVETMTVLFGTGAGAFTRLVTYPAPFSSDLLGITGIEAGDVDGDGAPDLLLTGVSNDVTLYLNNGTGRFEVPYRLGLGADASSPVYRDFTGDGRPDVLALTGLPLYGLDVAVSVLPGLTTPTTAADPGAPAGPGAAFALSAPTPNPAHGAAHLTLRLDRAQPVTVAVYDALGRTVATLHEGALSAGTHPLTVDAGALAPGLYVVRAAGDGGATTTRLVVAR